MTTVSQVFICNLGLRLLGERDILSLDENSKQARYCKQFYEQSIWEAIAMGPWLFAVKKSSLTMISGWEDEFEQWDYAYQFPNEMVTPYKLKSGYTWTREGEYLLTNDDEAVLKYTQIILDPTKYPRMFVKAMSEILASKLALPLAAKGSSPAEFLGLATLTRDQAMIQDGDQELLETFDGQVTAANEPWLTIRS